MPFKKIAAYIETFKGIWRYGRAERKLIITFVFLGLFGAITESFGVFLLVPLLETMGGSNIFGSTPLLGVFSRFFDALPTDTRLLWAGAIMLVVALLRGVIQFATDFIGYSIPHKIDLGLRLRAYNVLLNSSMKFVDTIGAGELSNVVVAHPARVGITLRFVAMLISNTVLLLSYITILTIVAPGLFLIALVYVGLTTLIYRQLTTRYVYSVGSDLTISNQKFSQVFFETLNGAKLIRLSGATTAVEADVKAAVKMLDRAKSLSIAVENMTVPFFSAIGGVLMSALVMIVGFLSAEMVAPAIGLLVIFFILIFRILAPLSLINISRNNIILHLDAFNELDKFYEMAESVGEPDGTREIDRFAKAIRLENVDFSYADEGPQVINGINLEIKRGQMVAFVGVSGSGKTTLINLITRLYRPTSGRVLVDGIDLNELKIQTWWQRMSVVTQETILTNNTIRANICLGLMTEVPDEQIRKAARLAAMDEWIESLPDGYDTELGDRGGRLSGGQRQRIVLARAFLRDPDILILDEATSALDTLTERAIQKELLDMVRKKTLIVIAHRLSTVRRADTIVVVDNGQVVETGSHNDLLTKRGVYWEMIQSQSLDMIEDEPSEPVSAS